MRPTPPARGCLRQSAAAFALVLSLVAGCNSAGGALHKVSGKVTVDGSPLATGNVRFVPDKARGNTATAEPVGQVGADGTYTLSTNGKAGAPAGWYKVTVDATEVPESSKPFAGKSLVARKYNAPELSGLSVEVVSSPKPGAYDLQVTSR